MPSIRFVMSVIAITACGAHALCQMTGARTSRSKSWLRTFRCESILHIFRRMEQAWMKMLCLSRYICISSTRMSTLSATANTALQVPRCLHRFCITFIAEFSSCMCGVLRLHERIRRRTMCSASSSTTRWQHTRDQCVAVSAPSATAHKQTKQTKRQTLVRTESHTRLDDDRKLRACFQHVQSLVRTVPQLVGIGRIGLRLAEAQTDRRRVSIGGLTNAVAADRALNSNELSNAITSNARVGQQFCAPAAERWSGGALQPLCARRLRGMLVGFGLRPGSVLLLRPG